MNCKFCGAEMMEDKPFCPTCGKDNTLEETPVEAAEEIAVKEVTAEETVAEETVTEEAPKDKSKKIALSITAIVVILALIIALIVGAAGGKKTDPADDATLDYTYTVPADTLADDVTHLGTYTVSDEDMIASVDMVVATMGGAELTLGDLQVYYWSEVFNFLNSYGAYASYLGLDMTVDLDKQSCTMAEVPMTWQQYFLGAALDTWCAYQALSLEADAAGHVMDQETVDFLENIPNDMQTLAVSYGFTTIEELLLANFGPGVTLDNYKKHMHTYYNGYDYFADLYDAVEFTDEEIAAYFEEKADYYAEQEITKESGNFVNVRHILVIPETNGTDAEGNAISSEEDWAAAEVKAQELLDKWLEGEKTEDSFAAMANEHSEDPGSNTNGGLYEDVYVGQMLEPFETWCFDETRVTGDYGIVKTDYGYHIMYFVDAVEIWYATAKGDMLNGTLENIIPDAVAKYELNVEFGSIKLGYLNLAG